MYKLMIFDDLDNAVNEYMIWGKGSYVENYITKAWSLVSEYDKDFLETIDEFDRVLTSTNFEKIQELEALKGYLDNHIPDNLEKIRKDGAQVYSVNKDVSSNGYIVIK